MKRQARVYLDDIAESIERIQEYVAGLTEEEFYENNLVQDSVIRRLEIIGEAAKGVSPELRKKHPEVKWPGITGTRDVLIHAYFRVNPRLVWKVVHGDLPLLREQIKSILRELD